MFVIELKFIRKFANENLCEYLQIIYFHEAKYTNNSNRKQK